MPHLILAIPSPRGGGRGSIAHRNHPTALIFFSSHLQNAAWVHPKSHLVTLHPGGHIGGHVRLFHVRDPISPPSCALLCLLLWSFLVLLFPDSPPLPPLLPVRARPYRSFSFLSLSLSLPCPHLFVVHSGLEGHGFFLFSYFCCRPPPQRPPSSLSNCRRLPSNRLSPCHGCWLLYTARLSATDAEFFFKTAVVPSAPLFPPFHQVYYAHMGVYTVVVASVSLLDYAEQRFWQLGLTGLRFGTFGAMVGLTALAMVQAPLPGHDGGGPPFLAYRTLAHLPGVGLFLPTAVYSQMMQTATPSIAAAARHPRALPRVLLLAFLTTCLMYCTMGAVLAMYFGEAASPNASLNFLHFTAGLGDPAPAWLRALTTVIVLFPALDMLSVYPLNVLVVSNILSSALDGARCWRPGSGAVLVRFAVSVIPIAGACVVKDINPVLRWTGSLGIFLSYLMPSLLQWASRRRMGPCEPCVPHCNGLLVLMVMGLASAAIAVVVVQTVLHG